MFKENNNHSFKVENGMEILQNWFQKDIFNPNHSALVASVFYEVM